MTKIIEGETEISYLMRCKEELIDLGRNENDAASECYHYWRSQIFEDISNTTDVELAKLKYEAFTLGYNYKKP